MTEKSEWPEVVGMKGKEAAEIIKEENPCLKSIVLADGSPVTKDLRWDRVRIFVDSCGIVVRTPYVG